VLTNVSEVLAASIIRAMSVYYTALRTHRRENIKNYFSLGDIEILSYIRQQSIEIIYEKGSFT
jgi:hypothetical protein